MGYMSAIGTTIYYIVYSVAVFLKWLLFVLATITAPLLQIALYVLHTCWLPLRFLAKFETLYIFFGVAALVGILTGASLHFFSGIIVTALHLEIRQKKRGRTVALYRMEKVEWEAKKTKTAMPRVGMQSRAGGAMTNEYAGWMRQDRAQGKRGLISTTILEEDDSSEAGF